MSAQLRLSAYAALATMATATALITVYSSSGWVVPVMGAILIVAASCAIVRSSPLPAALEPIAAAVAVLCWITLLDARSKAHFGFIPGRLALRTLGRTARHGFTEIHQLPTPAPAHHGLVMLTVIGVAAIALVVDLMTVTLRRAALSGLPLLALFTVCAATGHHGVGIFPFIAAAIGYLWLLFADNREKVARWGAAVGTGSRARPASAWSTDESSAPAPASLGRRVAAAAIGLGVVIPIFIPGLHTGIDKHGTGGSGSGSGNQLVIDPIVSVAADLQTSKAVPVISYRTSSPDPGYLRLTSLDMFNGTLFSSASSSSRTVASEDLPAIPPSGPIVTSTISVSPELKLNWLPAEATALGVSVGSQWRYDADTETIFSAATTTAGLRYTTKSVANVPTAQELNTVPTAGPALAADLIVPSSVSPALKTFTKALTSKATTRYDAALEIQSFFRTSGHFKYDTTIPANKSPNALADFVLRSRRGFCQQFATAMAVMARMVGIPSRVAVGFTAGTKQPDGSWLVTTHDAHAWPELYFQGYGWLPFEPTPRPGGQAVIPPYATGAVHTGPRTNPTPTSTQTSNHQTTAGNRHPLPSSGSNGSGGKSIGASLNPTGSISAHGELSLIVAVLLVMILALPGVSRVITRQRRWRRLADSSQAADAAWAELRDTAIDLRVPWDDGHTPRQIAATVLLALRADASTRTSMQRLANGEERSRYAPTSDVTATELRHDVTVIRSAATARRTGLQRVLARVVPRSTMRVVYAGIGHLGDVFEVFDRLGEHLRRSLHTKSHLGSEPSTMVSMRP